jgi:hypothetical protein
MQYTSSHRERMTWSIESSVRQSSCGYFFQTTKFFCSEMSKPSFLKAFQHQAKLMAEEFSLGAKLLVGFTQLLATVHCVREYLVDLTVCSGPSMIPTISSEGEVGELKGSPQGRWPAHCAGRRSSFVCDLGLTLECRFTAFSWQDVWATVLVDRISPMLKQIGVGDLVTASSPNNPYVSILKRVCAVVSLNYENIVKTNQKNESISRKSKNYVEKREMHTHLLPGCV